MSEMKPGSFYWAIPASDPDTDLQWQNEIQPARYAGLSSTGQKLWFWLGVEGSVAPIEPVNETMRDYGVSDWPAVWIGDEITPGRLPK